MKIKLLKNKLLYEELKKAIGDNSFRVFEGDETKIFPFARKCTKFLAATTGTSLMLKEEILECEGFTFRGDKSVIIIKSPRHDTPHKNIEEPHTNIDVQILIPTINGEVVKVDINLNKKEHVIKDKDIESFFSSDYWPKKKSGSISELYNECNFPSVKMQIQK